MLHGMSSGKYRHLHSYLQHCILCISLFLDHYLKKFLSFKAISLSLNFSLSLIETNKQCTYMRIWNMTQTIDYEYLSALCFIEICESWIQDVWIRKMRRVWMKERKMYVLIFIGVVYYLNKQKYRKTQILHLFMCTNQTLAWK